MRTYLTRLFSLLIFVLVWSGYSNAQEGACCWPDGSCSVELETDCWAQGGQFTWYGFECGGDYNGDGVDDVCAGACCLTCCPFSCTMTSENDCIASGGDYLGPGTYCLGDNNANGYDDLCEPPEGCCIGRVGDANGEGGDEPTIGDVAAIIDALFILGSPDPICCLGEADVNLSAEDCWNVQFGDITIGDVSVLIDYLFITGPSLGLPDCPCG